jgi:hypothetical protein
MKERDHFEDLVVDGRIILILTLEMGRGDVDRNHCWFLVDVVMNF